MLLKANPRLEGDVADAKADPLRKREREREVYFHSDGVSSLV